jgi:chromate transporter
MDIAQLGALFLYFLMLAFVAVGGAPSVLPEMHRYVVDVHAWMTSTQFAELYALAQVAPGPNVMYIPLIGWRVAGWLGAAATTIPFVMPSATITLLVAHLHARHPQAALGAAIRRGLTPITIGLIFASGWILLPAVNHDWRGYVLTALTVIVVLRTSLNPIWLLSAGAVAGMVGLVPN